MKLAECLEVPCRVTTLKHEAKHGYTTQKQMFVCYVKQLKELHLVHERTLLYIQRLCRLLK